MTKLKEIFQQVLKEQEQEKLLQELTISLEHHTYKRIPGTNNSYREDKPSANKNTQRHAHVYAKRNGGGKELYSVNLSGTGHDGSSGIVIPNSHADFLRDEGYNIPLTNSLESISIDLSKNDGYVLFLFEEYEA